MLIGSRVETAEFFNQFIARMDIELAVRALDVALRRAGGYKERRCNFLDAMPLGKQADDFDFTRGKVIRPSHVAP